MTLMIVDARSQESSGLGSRRWVQTKGKRMEIFGRRDGLDAMANCQEGDGDKDTFRNPVYTADVYLRRMTAPQSHLFLPIVSKRLMQVATISTIRSL